jgi:hypothetical protein
MFTLSFHFCRVSENDYGNRIEAMTMSAPGELACLAVVDNSCAAQFPSASRDMG